MDSREFNSKLPFELYKNNFEVIPVLLKSGDYILTDRIAIERKDSLTGDFYSSLTSGKLDK